MDESFKLPVKFGKLINQGGQMKGCPEDARICSDGSSVARTGPNCDFALCSDDLTEKSQMANPASVFCEQNGGKLEIRSGTDGGQVGYCKFSNGTECEEWKYFRGECK
jgi:putative hemolysin